MTRETKYEPSIPNGTPPKRFRVMVGKPGYNNGVIQFPVTATFAQDPAWLQELPGIMTGPYDMYVSDPRHLRNYVFHQEGEEYIQYVV